MKLHLIPLGEGKRDVRQWKFQWSRKGKTFLLFCWFYALVFAYGSVDFVQIYDQKGMEENQLKKFYDTTNRAQRRRFLHVIKRQPHAR